MMVADKKSENFAVFAFRAAPMTIEFAHYRSTLFGQKNRFETILKGKGSRIE
jgi:hypothetical protein